MVMPYVPNATIVIDGVTYTWDPARQAYVGPVEQGGTLSYTQPSSPMAWLAALINAIGGAGGGGEAAPGLHAARGPAIQTETTAATSNVYTPGQPYQGGAGTRGRIMAGANTTPNYGSYTFEGVTYTWDPSVGYWVNPNTGAKASARVMKSYLDTVGAGEAGPWPRVATQTETAGGKEGGLLGGGAQAESKQPVTELKYPWSGGVKGTQGKYKGKELPVMPKGYTIDAGLEAWNAEKGFVSPIGRPGYVYNPTGDVVKNPLAWMPEGMIKGPEDLGYEGVVSAGWRPWNL